MFPRYQKRLLFSLLLLLVSSSITSTAETVLLAECPKEPDVQGTFRNNGEYCVRDAQIVPRTVVAANCPDGFAYKGGKCKRRGQETKSKSKHNKSKYSPVKPTCPVDYQRYGDQCHQKCPTKEHRSKYKECFLPRKVLGTKYMTCADPAMHRYDAYCCTPGVNCPQLQCNLGSNVPGKFFYTADDSRCSRQAESVTRAVLPRPLNQDCPEGLDQVWGQCQEPCPYGFKPLQGRCELEPCVYDPMVEKFVECPEATYKVSQSIF